MKLYFFQEPMAGFVRKIPKAQTVVELCAATEDMKPFKPRSRNAAIVNFIGVAMLSVKPA